MTCYFRKLDMTRSRSNSLGWLLALLLLVVPTAPVAAETLDGIEVGITEAGHPYRGSADAPLTLLEFSDYLCPYCARYHRETWPVIVEKYVRSGKLRTELRHFPIASLHPTATAGHEAAACAARQSAKAFWTFHDLLFARQGEWNRLPDPNGFLAELADEAGLDMERYATCREDGLQSDVVGRDVAAGKERQFSGTPTFLLGDDDEDGEWHTIFGARPAVYFSDYIDALLAGEAPPAEPERPAPELPDWAKPASLIEDPSNPGFTVEGDPTIGRADARFVIVEFTDFQCPACAKHALETMPLVSERLLDTGKARWVVKHTPLPEHGNAPASAVAAVCAGDQRRYWEMHHALFANQDEWADLDEPDSALLKLASGLDLDLTRFAECLGKRQSLERVLESMHDATGITRSTPTFVVLDGNGGRTIRGARPAESFVDLVEQAMTIISANGDGEERS